MIHFGRVFLLFITFWMLYSVSFLRYLSYLVRDFHNLGLVYYLFFSSAMFFSWGRMCHHVLVCRQDMGDITGDFHWSGSVRVFWPLYNTVCEADCMSHPALIERLVISELLMEHFISSTEDMLFLFLFLAFLVSFRNKKNTAWLSVIWNMASHW